MVESCDTLTLCFSFAPAGVCRRGEKWWGRETAHDVTDMGLHHMCNHFIGLAWPESLPGDKCHLEDVKPRHSGIKHYKDNKVREPSSNIPMRCPFPACIEVFWKQIPFPSRTKGSRF